MSVAVDFTRKCSYADYLTWPDDERWEIIDGTPYDMSPAPNRRHQEILGRLFRKIADYFDDKPCRVYVAPFDVRLAEDYSDDHLIQNVVQPDISVFCQKKRLDDKGAFGAPDLSVEILSPSTAVKDMKAKLLLYQRFGVREYWIVDPVQDKLEIFTLDEQGRYELKAAFGNKGQLDSVTFSGLTLDLAMVFRD